MSDDHLCVMVAAAQSAPTSSNLQPWSVVVVRDPERKARLATYAAGQRFIEEAPVLLADDSSVPLSREQHVRPQTNRRVDGSGRQQEAAGGGGPRLVVAGSGSILGGFG